MTSIETHGYLCHPCDDNDDDDDTTASEDVDSAMAALEEEKEERLRAELNDVRSNIDADFAKLELMVCYNYDLEEVDEMDWRNVSSILAHERVKEWYDETKQKIAQRQESHTTMTKEEADEMIRRNMRLPAVFHKGKGLYRRFRPGQRVVLGKGWDYNGLERKGTVIRIFVNDDMESFPYEIETDEGIYLCVMEDMDHHIQHEEGSVIITDNDEIDEMPG